jgi:hypothetical protein
MKPPCTAKTPITDVATITPGRVVHDEHCAREWLIIGARIVRDKPMIATRRSSEEGVFPCLYFDTEMVHLSGKGAITLVYSPKDEAMHFAENGLRSGDDA